MQILYYLANLDYRKEGEDGIIPETKAQMNTVKPAINDHRNEDNLVILIRFAATVPFV